MSARTLIIAAHGSRREAAANAQVRRLAETVRARRLFDEVAVAFHQGEPGFEAVLDEVTGDEITVVPLFTSAGHYTETVLPDALRRNSRFGEVRLRQTPPVGTHEGIAPLVARRVTELLSRESLSRGEVSVLLIGHGTRRHAQSRAATLALAGVLERRRVADQIVPGFLDDEPSIEEALADARHPSVLVIPFLIGGGSHALADVPARTAAGRRVIIDDAVGTLAGIDEIVIDLARRNAPPPAPKFRRRGVATPGAGGVHLVGGGPGDPGLITARGLELLRAADVIVHDRLVGPELLAEARPGAELIDAGKGPGHAALPQEEINRLLVAHARRGRTVVRLKGGDPFVFGRGSEEAEACRVAGVPVTVVPGVSSAIAAPAAAGIPVTARGIARSFAVVTAHRAGPGGERADLTGIAGADTLVVLMGRSGLEDVARQLIAAGRSPETPAAAVQSATTAAQRVVRATLATIADAAAQAGLESPMVTVIGAVAALADLGGAIAALPAA